MVARRFYLPDTDGVPGGVTGPAFGSGWAVGTGTAKRRTMSTSKTGTISGGVDGQVTETAATTPENCLVFQYTSSQQVGNDGYIEPGTFSAVIGVNSNLSAPMFLQLTARVVSSDGLTDRGTLVELATQTSTVATSGAQNQAVTTSTRNTRIWNAIASNGLMVAAGDRIVVEIGIRSVNVTTTARTASLTSGDATNDKALTADVNATLNSDAYWVEFSSDVLTPTVVVPPDPPPPPTPDATDGYLIGVSTSRWSLEADTADPDLSPPRVLLDNMVLSWATEFLPPINNQPAAAVFQVYDDGSNPGGWLPIDLGDPVHVTLDGYLSSTSTVRLVTYEGRVADVSAVNHPSGGVVFTVICTDRLADLANTGAVSVLPASDPVLGNGIKLAYDTLIDSDGISLDPTDGTTQVIRSEDFREYELANVNLLDALSMVVSHDYRVGADGQDVSRYLTLLVDDGVSSPKAQADYVLVQYDPTDPVDLDHLFTLYADGPAWIIQPTPDYDTTYVGMVLDASQVLRDVGEWRKTRPQAINTIDVQGPFDSGTVDVVRVQHGAQVKRWGRNTRSVNSPLDASASAGSYGRVLLNEASQVQDGYGFTAATIVYEQLTDGQRAAWLTELWPHVPFTSETLRQALGKPLAILNIPDYWRLADTDVVAGRLLGATFTMTKGRLRVALSMRNVPPTTTAGISFDGIDSLSPEVTFDNLSDDVTFDVASLIHDPLS